MPSKFTHPLDLSSAHTVEHFSLEGIPGAVNSLCPLNKREVALYVSGAVAAWMQSQGTPSIEQMYFQDMKGGDVKTYQLDVIGLDSKSRFNLVEVKSSRADFVSDKKWTEYVRYTNYYYFAVPNTFPIEIIPDEPHIGLIVVSASELVVLRKPKSANGGRRYSLVLGLEKRAIIKAEACLSNQMQWVSRWMNGVDFLPEKLIGRTLCAVGGKIIDLLDKWDDRYWSPIMYDKWLKQAGAGRGDLCLSRKVALRIRALMFIYQEACPPRLDGKREAGLLFPTQFSWIDQSTPLFRKSYEAYKAWREDIDRQNTTIQDSEHVNDL